MYCFTLSLPPFPSPQLIIYRKNSNLPIISTLSPPIIQYSRLHGISGRESTCRLMSKNLKISLSHMEWSILHRTYSELSPEKSKKTIIKENIAFFRKGPQILTCKIIFTAKQTMKIRTASILNSNTCKTRKDT